MALTKQDIAHIAHLSRMTLSEDEIGNFTEQLSSILSYVETLNEVETDKVEPTAQVTGLTNVLRPDTVTNSERDTKKLLLTQRETGAHDEIIVPKTL